MPIIEGLLLDPMSDEALEAMHGGEVLPDYEDEQLSACSCIESCLVALSPLATQDCSQPVCVSFIFASERVKECLVDPSADCYVCVQECRVRAGTLTEEQAAMEDDFFNEILEAGEVVMDQDHHEVHYNYNSNLQDENLPGYRSSTMRAFSSQRRRVQGA